MPFGRRDDWTAALPGVRAAGLQTIALTPHPDALPLADCASRAADRLASVVGSGGFGMSRESLSRADLRVRIPIDPRADSLNVVSAAAIALYVLGRGNGSILVIGADTLRRGRPVSIAFGAGRAARAVGDVPRAG